MMRSTTRVGVALSVCALLAACGAPVQDARPTVRIAEAVAPSPARPAGRIPAPPRGLAGPRPNRMEGQGRQGRPNHPPASRGEADATPADCVSPTYRLQRVVYDAGPVQ